MPVTVEHARVLGLALTVDLAVLELLRARVVRGAIDFAELQDGPYRTLPTGLGGVPGPIGSLSIGFGSLP